MTAASAPKTRSSLLRTARGTLVWVVLLIGGITAGGVVLVRDYLSRVDEILSQKIDAALSERVPEWDVSFSGVHADAAGVVTLSNVSLAVRGRDAPLIEIPEIVITLDRELFAESQSIHPRHVELVRPTVYVTRRADGIWNWSELAPPPRSDAAWPAVDITSGTVIVHCERGPGVPETAFQCRSVSGRLDPSGHRQFAVTATTDVDHAGALAVTGSLNLKTFAWDLQGDIAAIDTEQGILDVAAGMSPELRDRMAALSDAGRNPGAPAETENDRNSIRFATGSNHPATSPVSDRPEDFDADPELTTQLALPELGVRVQMDVHFNVAQSGKGAPLDYSVDATIHDGSIVNAALPVPLYGLHGRLRASADEIVIEELAAANEESLLAISGRATRQGDTFEKDFSVKATNIVLDRRVRDYMHTDSARKMYDQISPAGRFNLDVHVIQDAAGAWDVTLNEFTAIRCSLLHEQFQYPITDIAGSIRQEDDTFHAELEGMAGDRPITLRGYFRNPGPEIELAFQVEADRVPLDERFVNALQQPAHRQVRRAMETLRLGGLADIEASLLRPPGPKQKILLRLHADVYDGVLDYERFPYRLTKFQGTIDYDPLQAPIWYFTNLRGEHDGAVLTGSATFDRREAPGRLDLKLTALQATLDRSLYDACRTAKPELATAWHQVSPQGVIDIGNAELAWTPGGPVDIHLPKVQLTHGRLKLAALPYQWDDVTGTASWKEGVISIHSLSGYHGETYLEIVGSDSPRAAYVDPTSRGSVTWLVHLEDVRIRKLVCDDELKQALPPGLRDVVLGLDPKGPLDLDFGTELKGVAEENVTAHWWLRVRLDGNDVFAGVQLENAVGNVEIVDGVWDGSHVTADGYVEIVSARALDMPVRNAVGPFAIDGNQITVGTPDFEDPAWRKWLIAPVTHTPDRNRYAGRQFDINDFYSDRNQEGRLGMQGVVHLGDDPSRIQYRMHLTLRDASLRAWARDWDIRGEKLQGAVNGEVTLTGRGTSSKGILGEGWVQISPAALYELPVFAQLFALPSFKPIRETAFSYALGDFTMHDGLFDFSAIELTGDAGDLVGRGTVEFAEELPGRLNLDFYSRADDQLLGGITNVPFIGRVFNNWVQVRVDGTLDDPRVVTMPGNPIRSVQGILEDLDTVTRPIIPPGLRPPARQPAPRRPPR